jgi:thiamine-phosphate pyrophosphorylase
VILPPLYAVCDADVCERARVPLVDLAAACLGGGARLLQLRAKGAASGWFLEAAKAVVALAHASGGRVIVNDRADIACLSGADGVHIGQEDLPPAEARAVVGADAVVGISTHTVEQVEAACSAAIAPGLPAYIAIGPVFQTATKETGYASVGLEMVRRAAAVTRRAGVPLVAIGGITIETAPDVIASGAASVAVITDLLVGGDAAARVRHCLDRLR